MRMTQRKLSEPSIHENEFMIIIVELVTPRFQAIFLAAQYVKQGLHKAAINPNNSKTLALLTRVLWLYLIFTCTNHQFCEEEVSPVSTYHNWLLDRVDEYLTNLPAAS